MMGAGGNWGEGENRLHESSFDIVVIDTVIIDIHIVIDIERIIVIDIVINYISVMMLLLQYLLDR